MKEIHPEHPAPSINNPERVDAEELPIAEEIEQLAFYGVTLDAIAVLVRVSQTQLTSQYAEAIAHGCARRQQFLLEELIERAEANEWPALRFALKNFLGMADNPEQAALQQHKLAQLRAQDAARAPELSPLPPRGPQPTLVQSGPASQTLPTSPSLPEQKKPPATVRPRQRPGKSEGGPACVPRK